MLRCVDSVADKSVSMKTGMWTEISQEKYTALTSIISPVRGYDNDVAYRRVTKPGSV